MMVRLYTVNFTAFIAPQVHLKRHLFLKLKMRMLGKQGPSTSFVILCIYLRPLVTTGKTASGGTKQESLETTASG